MHEPDLSAARHRFAREIFYDELWNDWTEAQLRTPPHHTMNSLAWILWHVARIEDVGEVRTIEGILLADA
ncbi:MAG: DinB family protein [Actinomycetota bacterium]